MKIYLCGPINGCLDEECKDWREFVKARLPDCIDPMSRDYRGKELSHYREIVDLDKRDVRNADVLLVYYDRPSVGTSMEILYAWQLGKPVLVVCAPSTRLSPWLIYHSTQIVNSLDQALKWLEQL